MKGKEMREAIELGFKKDTDYYAFRVSIKRELRKNGIVFDNDISTTALIQLKELI